jgi:hypothetical protein
MRGMAGALCPRRFRECLGGAVAVALATSCGAVTAPRPNVASCAAGWTAITPLDDDILATPKAMVYQDGLLYLASLAGVAALPTDGGAMTILVADTPVHGIWVEGDNVLYSNFDQLFAIPRAGGDATVLLDGGGHNDPSTHPDGNDVVNDRQLLDSTAFYWTTRAYPYSTDGTHAWRMLRSGGAVEGFVPLPIQTVDGLAVGSEGLLATGQSTVLGGPYYRAYIAPLGHGPGRELSLSPPPDKIISAETGALLASVYTGSRGGWNETHEVWSWPVDGSPGRPLAHNLPLELLATWAVPDGRGGHLLGGVEIFDDDENHGSVFQVSGDGNATRLACDASSNWPSFTAVAVAPDALYVSVRYDQPAFALVRIPRPPAE